MKYNGIMNENSSTLQYVRNYEMEKNNCKLNFQKILFIEELKIV